MRKISSISVLALLVTSVFAVLPKTTAAQDDDPPGRVARLNYMQGSISYQVSGDQDWVQADPNRPLTTGDNLWADQNSRGEVHIGSTAIRLSSETGLSFLTLDDGAVQLQLAQGTIEVHLRTMSDGDVFEVDTPNLAFTLDRPGEYRIATDPNGDSTIITVRDGQGEVTGGNDSWTLRAGQRYAFNGTDQLSYNAVRAPGFDDFENWCQSRNLREENSVSAKYVSRDVDGYYDLDQYGDWGNDAEYGSVWYPRGIASDWSPYHVGHWVYVDPWGWTWVDEEPWGFAPFHYGRWAYVRNRWGWVPGPVAVRPVYAPALVAFVGGGGWSLSVSFGGGFSGVAWYPLGPRDVFVPGYRASQRYVQNVNITNTRVINVTQVTTVYNTVVINHNNNVNYTYARNDRAVTAVSRDTFVGARSVRGASVRVTADQMNHVRVVDSAPIAPTRTSYVSATAKISNNRPAVPFSDRHVVERRTPSVQVNRGGQGSNNGGRAMGQQQNNQQGPQRGGNNNVNGQAPPPQPGDNNNNNRGNGGFRPFGPGNQQGQRGGNNNNVQTPAPQTVAPAPAPAPAPPVNNNDNRRFGQGNQGQQRGGNNNAPAPAPQTVAPAPAPAPAPVPPVNNNDNRRFGPGNQGQQRGGNNNAPTPAPQTVAPAPAPAPAPARPPVNNNDNRRFGQGNQGQQRGGNNNAPAPAPQTVAPTPAPAPAPAPPALPANNNDNRRGGQGNQGQQRGGGNNAPPPAPQTVAPAPAPAPAPPAPQQQERRGPPSRQEEPAANAPTPRAQQQGRKDQQDNKKQDDNKKDEAK